jgi:hypothetical protein
MEQRKQGLSADVDFRLSGRIRVAAEFFGKSRKTYGRECPKISGHLPYAFQIAQGFGASLGLSRKAGAVTEHSRRFALIGFVADRPSS